MDKRPTHFVDIHEILHENHEEEGITKVVDKPEKHFHIPIKVRDMNRGHRSFSRQVSLETGFSVLNREFKTKDEKKVQLPRSGRSFGGFDSTNRIGIEVRKADFSMFKTKAGPSKQNSLLPNKKEKEFESQRNIDGSEGLDESVNKSVPAGRYFAALRGPELDEVKVSFLSFRTPDTSQS